MLKRVKYYIIYNISWDKRADRLLVWLTIDNKVKSYYLARVTDIVYIL